MKDHLLIVGGQTLISCAYGVVVHGLAFESLLDYINRKPSLLQVLSLWRPRRDSPTSSAVVASQRSFFVYPHSSAYGARRAWTSVQIALGLYKKKALAFASAFPLASPARFERAAFRLGARSIHLYWR